MVISSHPKVRFVIIGGGELEERLKRKIDALDLKGKVILFGFQKDMVSLYSALDLFAPPFWRLCSLRSP